MATGEPAAAAPAAASAGAAAGAPAAPTALAILATARAAQAAHGLKHGDFARYRQYCTRRLLRLRRGARLTQGRGRFAPRPIGADDARRDPRALLVVLFSAERAWAAAMAGKKPGEGGSEAGRRRRVVLKLRRAVQAAELLRALVADVGDERTVFEAEAYAGWMAATLDLECEEWATALAGFERVGKVYAGIVAMCDGGAEAAAFEERADEVATAARFCRYNLSRAAPDGVGDGSSASSVGGGGGGGIRGSGGESGAVVAGEDEAELLRGVRDAGHADDMLARKIDAVLADARRREAASLAEVPWVGAAVPLRSEAVREAVLVAQERSAALRADADAVRDVDAYDGVFIAYNDAGVVVRKERGAFKEAASSRADERVAELDRVDAYLAHGRLSHTVDRNLLLVQSVADKKGSRPEDLVRLYDNLIQNVTDMLALAGVEEDPSFVNKTEAQRTGFRAHRCFHLAECYRIGGMLPEALALYDRVCTVARPLTGDFAKQVVAVVAQARGMKSRVHASEFIKRAAIESDMSKLNLSGGIVGAAGAGGGSGGARAGVHAVMTDHLDAFVSFAGDSSGARSVCDVPPALEAVPCKPVLFDLAIDGIKFPEPPADSQEEPAKPKASDAEPAAAAQPGSYFSRAAGWFSTAK